MLFSALRRFSSKPANPDALAQKFARCFNTEDGKAVLEHLHQHTFFRVIDPMMPEQNLRFVEGQRQLVLWLCQMIAKGKNPHTTETSHNG